MNPDPYVLAWSKMFALTLACELPIALALLQSVRPQRWLTVLIANVATHPIVWFVIARLGLPRPLMIAVAESWAVAFETLIYAMVVPKLSFSKALAVSALANAGSYTVGLLLS